MTRFCAPVTAAFLVAVGLCTAPVLAVESNTWMDSAALSATFKGQAVEGEYGSGRTFKETYTAGGNLAYQDDMRASGGHWSVATGTFCTIYDDDPAGGCFRVQQLGANCFEFFFVARTEDTAADPKDGQPAWTARAWIANRTSTCKERVGV